MVGVTVEVLAGVFIGVLVGMSVEVFMGVLVGVFVGLVMTKGGRVMVLGSNVNAPVSAKARPNNVALVLKVIEA
jgi:hypothetical protein